MGRMPGARLPRAVPPPAAAGHTAYIRHRLRPEVNREPKVRDLVSVRAGRVYDPPREADGIRVLVDRLWPRGMTKAKAAVDEWCKDVAPSTELRHWYGHEPQRSAEFTSRYRDELSQGEPAEALAHLREISADHAVTLLTATKDPAISHLGVLLDLLGDPAGSVRSPQG